ncbi:MAG: gliding motility-associated C-terminal domain-containing protein, partial [Flammeovirgaceae bacterium]
FTTPGTYKVIMELRNRCGFYFSNAPGQDLVIEASPRTPVISLPTCISFPLVLTDPPSPNWSRIWSTGDTNPTINLLGSASVSLTYVNAAGCRSTSSAILIRESIPLDLRDQIVCENDNSITIDTNVNPTFYTLDWSIDGVDQPAIINQRFANVNTTTAQLLVNPRPVYSVKVKDRGPSACEVTKNVTITINPAPKFNISNGVTAACGGNGTVSFQILAPTTPGGPFTYSIFGPFNPPNPPGAFGADQGVMAAPISLTGRAGGYFAFVTDQIPECIATQPVGGLSDPGLTFTATPTSCNPASIQISGASQSIIEFTVRDASSGAIVQGPTAVASLTAFTISNLTTGTNYVAEVRSATCIATQPVSIGPSTAPAVTITQDCLTLSATTGLSSYLWSTNTAGTIAGPTNGSSIQMVRPSNGAQVTYTLTASNGGCPNVQNIAVNVPPTLAVDFTISPPDGCAANVMLNSVSTPTSLTSYRWFNGANVFLGSNPSITVTATDTYRLDGVDANGCAYTKSNSVVVNGVVDAKILPYSPVCDDGKQFTLTSSTTATGVTYEWFLGASTTPIAGETSAAIQATQAGKYTVKISKGSGATRCTDSDFRIVSRIGLPQGSLLDAVVICADRDNLDPATNQVVLNPGQHTTYDWFYKADKQSSRFSLGKSSTQYGSASATGDRYTAIAPGIFLVDITDVFGCTNTDQTEVLNECIPKVVGPNAFRPGSSVPDYTSRFGTYSNKEFFVYSFFVTDNFEIAIYNRWGELVFQSNNRDFKWNGGYNNNLSQPLPGGTYTYVIRYQSSFRPQEGVKEQRGGVVLLR